MASHTPVPLLYGTGSRDGEPIWAEIPYSGSQKTSVDYPPLMLYLLGGIGRLYSHVSSGNFARPTTNAFVRAPVIAGDVLAFAVLAIALRRRVSTRDLRLALMAFWLNPAILLATTLGYLDAVAFPFALAALAAAVSDAVMVSAVLVSVALLLKPQAILFIPILLALWIRRGGVGGALRGMTGAVLPIVLCLVPFVFAGTVRNVVRALRSLGQHNMISGNACNLWWLVGYAIQVRDRMAAGAPLTTAITVPAQIVSVTRFAEVAVPYPRYVGVALLVVMMVIALRVIWRRPDLEGGALAAALLICSYFVLAAQVHENHFWPVIPLLIMAAALNPLYRGPAAALSVLFALNLAIFYGFGRNIPVVIPRRAGVDLSVPLSIAIVLAWLKLVIVSLRMPASARFARQVLI